MALNNGSFPFFSAYTIAVKLKAFPKKDWMFRGGVSILKSIKIATWKRSPQLDRKDKQRDAGITVAPRDCFSGTNLLPTTTISPTKSSGLAMQINSKKNSSHPSSNYIANSDSGDSIKIYRNKNIYGKNVDDILSWGGSHWENWEIYLNCRVGNQADFGPY